MGRTLTLTAADGHSLGAAHPEAAIHLYDAGHGFDCDRRASHDEAAAKLARRRTIDFFNTHPG